MLYYIQQKGKFFYIFNYLFYNKYIQVILLYTKSILHYFTNIYKFISKIYKKRKEKTKRNFIYLYKKTLANI